MVFDLLVADTCYFFVLDFLLVFILFGFILRFLYGLVVSEEGIAIAAGISDDNRLRER